MRDFKNITPKRNKVGVIIAKCSNVKDLFGIRIENFEDDNWISNWAFKIKEDVAKREGYDKTKISGSFLISSEYPGCPYCGNNNYVYCCCGKVSCHNSNDEIFTCPWCGSSGPLSGPITEMYIGSDR